MEYITVICDECGAIKAFTQNLCDNEIENILSNHPEWYLSVIGRIGEYEKMRKYELEILDKTGKRNTYHGQTLLNLKECFIMFRKMYVNARMIRLQFLKQEDNEND